LAVATIIFPGKQDDSEKASRKNFAILIFCRKDQALRFEPQVVPRVVEVGMEQEWGFFSIKIARPEKIAARGRQCPGETS
jgi:hypothetical protein